MIKILEDNDTLDELEDIINGLSEYFELDMEEWPMVSIYSQGSYYSGIIDEELYGLLIRLMEIRDSNQED